MQKSFRLQHLLLGDIQQLRFDATGNYRVRNLPKLLKPAIDRKQLPLLMHHQDAIRGGFKSNAQEGLTVIEPLLRHLAGLDVEVHPDHAPGPTRRRALHRNALGLDPAVAPILVEQAEFNGVLVGVSEKVSLQRRHDRRFVIRMQERLPNLDAVGQLVHAITEHGLPER